MKEYYYGSNAEFPPRKVAAADTSTNTDIEVRVNLDKFTDVEDVVRRLDDIRMQIQESWKPGIKI